MTREELEYSISQFLDGTLQSAEQAVLEDRLAVDSEARELLAEYRQLDVVLKASPLPEVQWNVLADQLSAAVAQSHNENLNQPKVARSEEELESLEFAVSEYVGGTLSIKDRTEFESRLHSDSEVAVLLEQYQRLNQLVKSSLPLPMVRWDVLANHLSSVVADAGAKPVFSFKWARTASRLAIAACLLVAAQVGFKFYRTNQHIQAPSLVVSPGVQSVVPERVAIINGPQMETPVGKQVLEVEIGGPAMAEATSGGNGRAPVAVDIGSATQFADVVVSRPSRVVIANGDNSAEDSGQMPY